MEFDERRKLIVSILRMQNETKTLMSRNNLGNRNVEQSKRINELQATIHCLREEIGKLKSTCGNLENRRISAFVVVSKVVIESMRSERAMETHNTIDILLKSKEFMELFKEMTHVAFKSVQVLECVTSILLEFSLSAEGRRRLNDLGLCQFISSLFGRKDLVKNPAILYRLFNTVLNLVTLYQPTRAAFTSRNAIGNLKNIENAVSRDPKLSSKLRTLMVELGKDRVMRPGSGFMKFVSPQPRGYQRRNSRHGMM